jgi:hypothetical protein
MDFKLALFKIGYSLEYEAKSSLANRIGYNIESKWNKKKLPIVPDRR